MTRASWTSTGNRNPSAISRAIERSAERRVWRGRAMLAVLCGALVASVAPLFSVLALVAREGFSAMSWTFLSSLPAPVGETGGGMGNALLGSAILIGVAGLIGLPWGVATGVFLAEYGGAKLARIARFSSDLLASVPSIVLGLFVYAVAVVPFRGFSALSGSIALALVMIPTIARTTEEVLRLVPLTVREAGLALGLARWKTTLWIVVKGTAGPISTGVLLALARAAGETAPLLFTAFGSRGWPVGLGQPIASLPVQIYTYAISPYDDWRRQAWAGSLLLVLFVLALNLLTRLALSRRREAA